MQPLSQRLLCLTALYSVAAYSQIGTSTLTGRITDTTGAVVPKVSVTVVQTGTNFTQNTVSNDEGIYRVLSLQPGTYRITFDTAAYFGALGIEGFYPEASIVFVIRDAAAHYHVPLLLSAFGYSTYRGS